MGCRNRPGVSENQRCQTKQTDRKSLKAVETSRLLFWGSLYNFLIVVASGVLKTEVFGTGFAQRDQPLASSESATAERGRRLARATRRAENNRGWTDGCPPTQTEG